MRIERLVFLYRSQQAAFRERHHFGITHHEMIEQTDLHQRQRLAQAPGKLDVGRRQGERGSRLDLSRAQGSGPPDQGPSGVLKGRDGGTVVTVHR